MRVPEGANMLVGILMISCFLLLVMSLMAPERRQAL